MSKGIFADNAPGYWAKGLPAIPLRVKDKMPVIDGWNFFSERMPTLAEQQHWLQAYPDNNIGLVLGPQSGLVMIDIDTEDENLQRVIIDALKPFVSPWERKGKRGLVLAFKAPLVGAIRTFHINRAGVPKENAALVDGLSARSQVVLPPSIHPSTLKPYTENCSLLDVLDDLPCLPADVETILRGALSAEGDVELSNKGWTRVTDFAAAGARDNQMTRVAGLMAQGVTRGEMPLLEAVDRMYAWQATCVEKVAGDDVDIQGGIKNLIGFLTRDVLERKKTLPQGWDKGMTDEQKVQMGLNFTTEHEEWSYDQIINYLMLEHQKHGMASVGWIETVNYVLERIARSTSLGIIKEGSILNWINKASGGRLSMSMLTKQLQSERQGDVLGQNQTEVAEALKLKCEEFGPLKYHMATFWQWEGSHWEEKDRGELLTMVARDFGNLPAAKRYGDHRGIVDILSGLCAEKLQVIAKPGVNFANGYLTDDGKLIAHDPDYGCTYTLPYRYLPGVGKDAKKFMGFIERCWTSPENGPDKDITDKKAALQEIMAATLFGVGAAYQRVCLLHGFAETGKSQLLDIVTNLMPDGSRSMIPPEEWHDKFKPAEMTHKLINIAGELSEKKKIDGTWFKKIVAGEEINVQRKNQQPFNMRPACTHWFASNHLPLTDDRTEGFTRRWLVLTFFNRVRRDEIVRGLGNLIVADEREQIVSWVVEGMARLKASGNYTLPASHEEEISVITTTNDSVRYFIEKSGLIRIVRAAPESGSKTSHRISEDKLREEYSNWCMMADPAKRVTLPQFKASMIEGERALGYKRIIEPSPLGHPIIWYENIMFVKQVREAA